jgi:hypothetical protein
MKMSMDLFSHSAFAKYRDARINSMNIVSRTRKTILVTSNGALLSSAMYAAGRWFTFDEFIFSTDFDRRCAKQRCFHLQVIVASDCWGDERM